MNDCSAATSASQIVKIDPVEKQITSRFDQGEVVYDFGTARCTEEIPENTKGWSYRRLFAKHLAGARTITIQEACLTRGAEVTYLKL